LISEEEMEDIVPSCSAPALEWLALHLVEEVSLLLLVLVLEWSVSAQVLELSVSLLVLALFLEPLISSKAKEAVEQKAEVLSLLQALEPFVSPTVLALSQELLVPFSAPEEV